MQKSEAYHLAQIAVISSTCISNEGKIKALKILFDDEKLALFVEEQEAKERESCNAETV